MPAQFSPLQLSFFVALGALLISFPLGVLAARALQGLPRPLKIALESVLLLPLVMPPVVTGLILLLLLGARGPLVKIGIDWLFTPQSAILASAITAFPLVYTSAKTSFAGVSPELDFAARSLGATPFQTFWNIVLPLSAPGLLGGAILAFARGLGEFGATVMVAGNLEGKTLTAPVAIYFAVENGELGLATQLALALGALNLLFMAILGVWGRQTSPR